LATGAWLTLNWPAVAAAAEHAQRAVDFQFLSRADALDVEAITAQILPSGATVGAREARAVHFIDRALLTFLADRAAAFRSGLAELQHAFRKAHQAAASFAAASPAEQIAFLKSVDHTPFFASMRTLTILGTFSAKRYGGNFEALGWKLIGFEDQHAFSPPFGHYDAGYRP
jgi:hypothetical protein